MTDGQDILTTYSFHVLCANSTKNHLDSSHIHQKHHNIITDIYILIFFSLQLCERKYTDLKLGTGCPWAWHSKASGLPTCHSIISNLAVEGMRGTVLLTGSVGETSHCYIYKGNTVKITMEYSLLSFISSPNTNVN